jgi:putative hydrolase of the HAD superfamily
VSPPPPAAVLLDALGTLILLEPPAPRLRRELSRRFGVEVSEAEAERAIAAEIAYYRANMDAGRDVAGLAALRRRCAAVLREALAQHVALRNEDLTDALLASLEFTAFADARPMLEVARARDSRLVVVSNWDVSLHDVLERVGIARLVDRVLTSAEVGARKPAPRIFGVALGVAGVPAQHAIHVGDSIEEDVAGARAAGVEPVLLRRDGRRGPAEVRTIATLTELIEP